MHIPIKATFATASAWRAIYLSRRIRIADGQGESQGVFWCQFFHMGVDPTGPRGPEFFGGIKLRQRTPPRSWRIVCPHVTWKFPAGRAHKLAYAVSSRFWRSLDGRYGALRPGVLLRLRARLRAALSDMLRAQSKA